MMKNRKSTTETMVLGALMTALVVVFQLLATYTAIFGPFSAALALLPIIIGAALCGPAIGAWLGLVFGLVVLLTGGAALFWPFSDYGTIITVLCKGAACGFAAGAAFRLLEKTHFTLATVVAALLCPLVNTGVFLLGCAVFFLPSADAIAAVLSLPVSGMAVFWALATGNFLFEVGLCAVLSPLMLRLITMKKR